MVGLFPSSIVGRVSAGAAALTGLAWILGELGSKIGAFRFTGWSWWWSIGLVAILSFLIPRDQRTRDQEQESAGRRRLVLLLLTGLMFFLAASNQVHDFAKQAPRFPVRVHDLRADPPGRQTRLVPSIRFADRSLLRRLSGQRRHVRLEAELNLRVPRSGLYEIEVSCDDSCEWTLVEQSSGSDGVRPLVQGAQSLELNQGNYHVRMSYRQDTGPAWQRLTWDTPAWIEWHSIDHFLSATAERPATSPLLRVFGVWFGWVLLTCLWFGLVEQRHVYRRWLSSSGWIPALGLGFILLASLCLRIDALWLHTGTEQSEAVAPWHRVIGYWLPASVPRSQDPYRADVRSYLDRASAMEEEGFYAPSFREPFYVSLVRLFVAVEGSEHGILTQSLWFSWLSLVLFAAIAYRLWGYWWAAALLTPLTVQEWLIREAPSGYRLGAYVTFFLLTLTAMFVFRGAERWRGLLDGFIAGLWLLIRLSAVTIVVPLLVLRLAEMSKPRRASYTLGFLLSVATLVGPFLWSNAAAHGDPFYSISFHTEFWMRAEGLAPKEGPVSLSEYLFRPDAAQGQGATKGSGRFFEFLYGSVAGVSWLPLRTFWTGLTRFPILNLAMLTLGIVGLIASGIQERPRWLYLPVAYFGHLLPFAYIQNFPSGTMPRFVMPSYFILLLAVPLGVRQLDRWLESFRKASPKAP